MSRRIKLPLHPFEPPPQPCVGSGLCCQTSVCDEMWGSWDAEKHQCTQLIINEEDAKHGIESFRCARYNDIVAYERANEVRWPMFGPNSGGCCKTLFNRGRMVITRAKLESGVNLPHLTDLCPSVRSSEW